MNVTPDNVKEVLEVLAPVEVYWSEFCEKFVASCQRIEIGGDGCLTSCAGFGDNREDALMELFYRLSEVEAPLYIVRWLGMFTDGPILRLHYRWNGSGFAAYRGEVRS